MTVYVGTSGFYYDDWKENFYPEDTPKKNWLRYYASIFRTVEINNTFYNIPKPSNFEKWARDTPHDFKFTLKGNRYVTHQKKLNEPEEGMHNFYRAIEPLAGKTDCVLWQLPPSLQFEKERLVRFAKACSTEYSNVIEFRHNSWFNEECYGLLHDYKLSFCMLSTSDELPEIPLKTSRTAYLRFHGKDQVNRYRYNYSRKELLEWVVKINKLRPQRIFVYFNNDFEANAIKNARSFLELVTE